MAIGVAEFFLLLKCEEFFISLIWRDAGDWKFESFIKFEFLRDNLVVLASFFADQYFIAN